MLTIPTSHRHYKVTQYHRITWEDEESLAHSDDDDDGHSNYFKHGLTYICARSMCELLLEYKLTGSSSFSVADPTAAA